LISIIIPNSVESIGVDAFAGCINLVSVTITNGQLGIPSPAVDVFFFGTTVTTYV
jgi:hypothetical protein